VVIHRLDLEPHVRRDDGQFVDHPGNQHFGRIVRRHKADLPVRRGWIELRCHRDGLAYLFQHGAHGIDQLFGAGGEHHLAAAHDQ